MRRLALGLAGDAREARYRIELDAQPVERLEHQQLVGAGGALAVRVLEAQQEAPTVAPRERPAEQRRARSADMERPGRAGRVAGHDVHRRGP